MFQHHMNISADHLSELHSRVRGWAEWPRRQYHCRYPRHLTEPIPGISVLDRAGFLIEQIAHRKGYLQTAAKGITDVQIRG